MSAKYEVGSIVTGKVTGIQPYGAFVALDEETQGLIHISEITHGYVRNIEDYLKVGDEVQAKIVAIDEEDGKISLSMREMESSKTDRKMPRRYGNIKLDDSSTGFNTLKEKLKEWIAQSEKSNTYQKK
ncbi:S1 domain-containing post-transcriptional regulator GSP13 [Bacillus smithii]|uniref:S1 domain-containing post-transcriptional regulator GSP13 n=1 Tax=Bacillus smithii TaxID=1479 RepID=UPI002E1EFB91|nr:S1 domain-containing post-transcriptional regulator GSP13 [Bacillus smithii]MED1456097.1 S1 domain-containing post-transcriptional regulator GSP13 [Bacillus smithii]MED1489825.1 S1 domain-containing post-transcriptional regulator GSP13 [Bacillus smithii]